MPVQGIFPATDQDGDALRMEVIEPPRYGSVVFQPEADGRTSFTYQPPADHHGMDGFIYLIRDGRGGRRFSAVSF
jgi:hypothetical protein